VVNEYGAVGGMKIGKGNQSTQRKPGLEVKKEKGMQKYLLHVVASPLIRFKRRACRSICSVLWLPL
jgi:hypothetical protein